MYIISIINVKGGVGKTTTTFNLAGAIAHDNKKVLLIDNDSQSNLTQICNMEEVEGYTMYDLYDNAKVTVDDCIQKFNTNIDIIPNCIDSALLETSLHGNRAREYVLKSKFEQFRSTNNNYDYILIDNSPFLGTLTTNAMTISDYYIQVIDNSISALKGLRLVQKLVDSLKHYRWNTDISELGILRNNFLRRTRYNNQVNEVVETQLGNRLFNSIIYNSVKYKEAVVMNTTIQDYSKKHAKDFNNLYVEIEDRIGGMENE